MKIAPSILSADFSRLGEDVKQMVEYGVDYIHIDMMDGQFVNNISFGPMIMKSIRDLTDLPFDCHMMIQNPERYIPQVAQAGADIITIHAEATQHIHGALQQIKNHHIRAGVVINPGTAVSVIEPVLADVDMVLVMSVNPGFGGQSFIEHSLDKIKQLVELRDRHDYHYEIEIDGGINEATAKLAREAGVDVLVAGSYIFNHTNRDEAIQSLR